MVKRRLYENVYRRFFGNARRRWIPGIIVGNNEAFLPSSLGLAKATETHGITLFRQHLGRGGSGFQGHG